MHLFVCVNQFLTLTQAAVTHYFISKYFRANYITQFSLVDNYIIFLSISFLRYLIKSILHCILTCIRNHNEILKLQITQQEKKFGKYLTV